MADRPIIFSGPMVQALLAGRKTQTRRVLKPQPKVLKGGIWYRPYPVLRPLHWNYLHGDRIAGFADLPYAPGDRLYVREAHAILPRTAYRMSIGTGTISQTEHPTDGYSAAVFREGFDRSGRPRWRPSIHMPRWASRLTLTVTDVRVQRLQDISEADAVAEGWKSPEELGCGTWRPVGWFFDLWRTLHGPDAWDANPWVVALTFTVEQRNIDAERARD